MREWSNFTRNAIDQLQIVLTNLKSKLGKFLWCLKMAKFGLHEVGKGSWKTREVGKFEMRLQRMKLESLSRSWKIFNYLILPWKLSNFKWYFPTKNVQPLVFSNCLFQLDVSIIWAWHCIMENCFRNFGTASTARNISTYFFERLGDALISIMINRFNAVLLGPPPIFLKCFSFLQKYHDEIIFNHDHLRIRSSSDFDIFIFSTNI